MPASTKRSSFTPKGGEDLILQRIGGDPFDDDARTPIGRTIVGEGHRLGRLFRYFDARDDDE
jgi:hypothetical protein